MYFHSSCTDAHNGSYVVLRGVTYGRKCKDLAGFHRQDVAERAAIMYSMTTFEKLLRPARPHSGTSRCSFEARAAPRHRWVRRPAT